MNLPTWWEVEASANVSHPGKGQQTNVWLRLPRILLFAKKLLKQNLNRSDGKGKDWLIDKYLKDKNFRKGAVTKLKTEGLKQKRGGNKLLQSQNGVELSQEEEHSPFKGEQPDSKGYLHSACFHLYGILEKAKCMGMDNRTNGFQALGKGGRLQWVGAS